jgi:hypothetical protein
MGDNDDADRRHKDHVSDIPVFYGSTKDSINADFLVNAINAAQELLLWSPAEAYLYFKRSLRDRALAWIELQEATAINFVATWVFIQPLFKRYFGDHMDKTQVYNAFSTCKMTNGDTPLDYSCKVNKVCTLLHDNARLGVVANIPADNAQRTDAYIQQVYLAGAKKMLQELQTCMLISGMPDYIQGPLISKDPQTLPAVLDEALKIYQLKMKNGNGNGNGIHAIDDTATEEEFINVVKNSYQAKFGAHMDFAKRLQDKRAGQSNNGNGSGYRNGNNGNNGNRSSNNGGQQKFACKYCKKPNHSQDECRTRIKDNKPCIATSGKPYWPRKTSQNPVNEDEPEQASQVKESTSDTVFH